ncbi:hypothetical protein ACIRPT_09515 [Streptomyces sp. NPDC101227]|uniref:hypothetical protein n=1 Tax=Streptomyces sp. NPDC101227 TaxID=3366136 RepID=UPI00380F895D
MSRGGALHRMAAHEARWLAGLVWWAARRRIGVGAGERALAYAAGQSAFVYALTFVCGVETAGVSVLLADHPVPHAVMLVVDVYTVLMMLGFQAAAVTRPHVLGADTVLLRAGARMEIRVPLAAIVSVRQELRSAHDGKGADGAVAMSVGGQTSVTLELAEPVVAVRLSGRREAVRTVRFHADDARGAAAAIRAAVRDRSAAGDPAAVRQG